jgi:peptidoglycan/xylan/chitin deacetylase (PgdA/CDA1 family)
MVLNSSLIAAKGLIRSGRSLAYYATGRYKRANLGQFVILMYHRVLADDDPYLPYIQPGMYVRESSFAKQLKFLTQHYEVVSLAEMLELIEAKKVSKDRQYCVITFDDGWLDNYRNAFPLLKRFSVPATIFLTASFIGTNRFFWHEKISKLFFLARNQRKEVPQTGNGSDEKADEPLTMLRRHILSNEPSASAVDAAIESLKSLPIAQIEGIVDAVATELGISFEHERTMLSWEEIQEMGQGGISFGSHTCEHRILTQIDLTEAAAEITGSMEKLKNKNLNYIPVFCYPNGRYNDAVRSLVIDAGYSAAVTTKLGRQSGDLKDPYTIARIGIHDDIASDNRLLSYRLR